jgi:hypothetical protein
MGKKLGFDLGRNEVKEARGIGDTVVPYALREATVLVGATEAAIRLAWALVDEVPLVLGRLDVFDRFRVEFDQPGRVMRFVPKE